VPFKALNSKFKMSDSVAEKSGFLKMYMSNHPDTLVAYVKWYGKVTENIASAEMTAIDSKSMTLTYKTKAGASKVAVVPIEPPLAGYEEVKNRLLGMKAEAQEGLGMIKAPQISTFVLPKGLAVTGGMIACLCYCTFFPRGHPSPLFTPAHTIFSAIGGDFTLKLIWGFMVITHTLESVYTYTLCKKHRTGFVVGASYVISTILFGYPTWVDLRKRIQAARIESVMKVE